MASFVESTLTRSRPTRAFTAGVLAAIAMAAPATSAAATATSVAVVSASSAKGAAGVSGAIISGPAVGLATVWLTSRLLRLNARSPEEARMVARQFRRGVTFTLAMIAFLMAGLFVCLTYFADSPWLLITLTVSWTAVLLARLIFVNQGAQTEINRARAKTGTSDADYPARLAVHGLKPAGPHRYASKWRLFGLPLFAFASGGLDIGGYQTRGARGWIAVGDVAISPLLAIGGLACAPIAIGGATAGFLSLSLGGLAVGALAFGSIAAGWWSFGVVSLGWKAAAGATAIARDYAVGATARAAEANTAVAAEWFPGQWFTVVAAVFGAMVPWLILLAIVIPVGMLAKRAWHLRRMAAHAGELKR
jgi:hypothetical protein